MNDDARIQDVKRRRRIDVATAVAVFLARVVYSGADAVAERLSITQHAVNSIVGKLVVPFVGNDNGRVSLRSIPVVLVVQTLLKNKVLTVGEQGFEVDGKRLRDIASSIYGARVADDIEKYLLSTVSSDIALLGIAVKGSEKVPEWFAEHVVDNAPISFAVSVVVLNRRAWEMFPAESKRRLLKRLDSYNAREVLEKAPWAVDSRSTLMEVLSKLVWEELPDTATELIARYAPEIIGESQPVLVKAGSTRLISKSPAIVRVDVLGGLSPESEKEFTVFDTRTKLGIVVSGRTVSEAVEKAYSCLIDAYLEFKEIASSLEEYSRLHGVRLARRGSITGEYVLPGITIYGGDDEPVVTIPLQPEFRRALEDALHDVRMSQNNQRALNTS